MKNIPKLKFEETKNVFYVSSMKIYAKQQHSKSLGVRAKAAMTTNFSNTTIFN